LHASDGRETNALNCKPNTNLKEKYELSNYSKTSGFILHAVSGWGITIIYNGIAQSYLFCQRTVNFSNVPVSLNCPSKMLKSKKSIV
jgi:hypothetical protein